MDLAIINNEGNIIGAGNDMSDNNIYSTDKSGRILYILYLYKAD